MWSFSWASTQQGYPPSHFLGISQRMRYVIALLSWINEADKNFAASKKAGEAYCATAVVAMVVAILWHIAQEGQDVHLPRRRRVRARMISGAEKGSSIVRSTVVGTLTENRVFCFELRPFVGAFQRCEFPDCIIPLSFFLFSLLHSLLLCKWEDNEFRAVPIVENRWELIIIRHKGPLLQHGEI